MAHRGSDPARSPGHHQLRQRLRESYFWYWEILRLPTPRVGRDRWARRSDAAGPAAPPYLKPCQHPYFC